MAANPNGFDYYRRGQLCVPLKAKVDNKGLDYFRRGQPFMGIIIITTAAGGRVFAFVMG